MDKLNRELREMAERAGMCDKVKGEWNESWDMDTMADKMLSNINFCAQRRFPDKDYLIKNFDRAWLRNKGIIADDRYSLLNPERALITGMSDSHIRFNGISSGKIHIQGEAKVDITAKNRSHVIVHVWDRAQVEAEKEDKARILIIRHSRDAVVIAGTDIPIRDVL